MFPILLSDTPNKIYRYTEFKKFKNCELKQWTGPIKSFFIDILYIRLDGPLFWQIAGFHMRPNCAPLVADLFLYLYKNEFWIDS